MSEKKISPIKILKRITPLVFKATPFFFGLFIVITILHGLSWAVKILFLQISGMAGKFPCLIWGSY